MTHDPKDAAFIQRLKKLQEDYPREALLSSHISKEEARGFLQGLQHAEQLFLGTIGEEDDGTESS